MSSSITESDWKRDYQKRVFSWNTSNDDLLATIEPEIEIQLGDMEIEFEATNDTLEQPDIKLEQVVAKDSYTIFSK